MYNEFTHDIKVLGFPNVVYPLPKGDARLNDLIIPHGTLLPLVERLAKARPKWTLVGDRLGYGGDNKQLVLKFNIYDGNEMLGVLRKGYERGNDVIEVINARLGNARQRSGVPFTKDVSKAFRMVIGSFGLKTPDERLKEAQEKLNSIINSAHLSAAHKLNSAVRNLAPTMQEFAVRHWAEYRAFAAGKADSTYLDTFSDLRATHEGYADLAQDWGEQDGTIVLVRGNEYILKQGDAVTIVDTDGLPPHIKRNVGLLKLADNLSVVPGVGARGAGDEMYVIKEPQNVG